MTYKTDFLTKVSANLPDNATKQITAAKHREVLEDYLADKIAWLDEMTSGGFAPQWTRVADGTALGSLGSGQFSVDDYANVTTINFNINANSPSDDLTYLLTESASGTIITLVNITDNTDFIIFKVTSRSTTQMTGTVIVNELAVNGGDNYAFTFDFSQAADSDLLQNYFVNSFSELQSAVTSANAAGGGNIYCTGDITFTQNVSWDLTGITFIGFKAYWKMLNSNGVVDGSTAYKITITDGHPVFKNINFTGSAGATSNVFQSYSSREIIEVTSDRIDMTFDSCVFADIIGGLAEKNVINYATSLLTGSVSILTFKNCTFTSHNNYGTAFYSVGFRINCSNSNTNANLVMNVTNQLSSLPQIMSNSTDRLYNIEVTNGGNFSFYTDGSAWVEGADVSAANTENIITKAYTGVSLLGNEKFSYSDENNIINQLPFYAIPLIYMPLNQQVCKPTTVSGTPTAYQFSLDNADPSLATSFKVYVNDSALDAWKLLSTSHLIVIRLGLSYASFQVSGSISFSGNVITVPVTSSNTNISDYTTLSDYYHNISFIQ